MGKVVVLIKGGLGNQLFSYAAARRLAYINNVELVIDNVSYFKKDKKYKRNYQLDNFHIVGRKARLLERFEPFRGYLKSVANIFSGNRLFERRNYFIQEGEYINEELLDLEVTGNLYLNGYWQSEKYFYDIKNIIKNDLKFHKPKDKKNKNTIEKIEKSNSVALHVRWYHRLRNDSEIRNLMRKYYQDAIAYIESKVDNPHFFLFSDDPKSSLKLLDLNENKITTITHNQSSTKSYADLWLMSSCKHIITADSTFSWWAAWLGENDKKLIVTPSSDKNIGGAWGTGTRVPKRWKQL